MTMIKTASATAIAMIALAAPASATVFNYESTIGNGIGDTNIAIDSTTGTARLTGDNINLTLQGASLIGFDGTDVYQAYETDSIDGTFTRNGTTYDAFQSSEPKHTQLALGNDFSFLWTFGTDPNGNTFDFDGKGNLTLASTTPGGTGGGADGGGAGGGTGGGGTGGGTGGGGNGGGTGGTGGTGGGGNGGGGTGGGGNGGGGNGGGNTGGGSVPGPAPLSLIAGMALFGAWRRRRANAA